MTARGRAARVLGAAVLLSAACRAPDARRYALRGVVQAAQADGKWLVAHEDVAGFMPAMTMAFRVEGGGPALAAGDAIRATLAVSDTAAWLEGVTVTAHGQPVHVGDAAPTLPAGPAPGDAIPDLTLVSQDARPLHLADFRGHALAITFIYTRCPLPDFCPLMMRNFQRIDDALAADPALFAATRLLSVSFDSTYDTPEVLRRYGAAFVKDRGPGRFAHWQLATGSARQVKAAADFFGVSYAGEGPGLAHTLRTAIVGPDGRVARVLTGSSWTVEEALALLRQAAAPLPKK